MKHEIIGILLFPINAIRSILLMEYWAESEG